jgi:hypothetical protein
MLYHHEYKGLDEIPVVQAATAYDDPDTAITYILILNQSLWIPRLETTLLNPNQLCANGIIVDECPTHLAVNLTEDSLTIICP